MCGLTSFVPAIKEAAVIFAVSAAVSLAVNAVRENGIPFVRYEDYEVLVPCPETMGDAEELLPDKALLNNSDVLLVDARAAGSRAVQPVPGSMNVPYDYLEETPDKAVSDIAASGAKQVAVFGDGAEPDSGEQLAKELSGRGIRNVGFIKGGAPAVLRVLSDVKGAP